MGEQPSQLTEENIQILKKNPYTRSVENGRLVVTLEAKQKILKMHEEGMTHRQIVEALGYNSRMLGKERTKNMVRGTLRSASSPRGFRQGYARKPGAHMETDEIEQLDCSAASYDRLKNEVIFLREEVEVLKKIFHRVILGKRGE